MTMARAGLAVLLLWTLLAAPARAQVIPEREVELTRQLYDNGKYQEALRRAGDSMALTNFTDPQRAKLLEIAGLAAFALGDLKTAQQRFLQLLMLNPDTQLDPFAVPPAAIKLFEQVRKENREAITLVRQQQALREEQDRRVAAEAERARREDEERRRKLEALAQKITVRTVEKRSLLVNFLPFGAGQFQQERVGAGVGFAVTEAVMAITSLISFFAINALYEDYPISLTDRLTVDGGPFNATIRRIPRTRENEYRVWTALKFSTGGTFYGLWVSGVVEALLRHKNEVVTETQETAPPPPSATPSAPSAHLTFFPTQGGLGAGLTFTF
jgi:tetratricopeptide (TPR) repeat protein